MPSDKPKNIALALGSNLGDRKANIAFAIEQLKAHGLKNIQCAEALESAPLDCPDNSETYLNTALTGQWLGSPLELLETALKIEKMAGRERSGIINEPRELDIDVLLIDNETHNSIQLTVPHPRMHLRDFVLAPLAEIQPNWILPTTQKSIQQHLSELTQHA